MSPYRIAWLLVAWSLGVGGLGVALLLVPTVLVVVGPLVATVGALIAWQDTMDGQPLSRRARGRRAGVLGLVSGAGAGAVVGLVALIGPAAVLLAAVVTAASPGALDAGRRMLRSVRRTTAAELDDIGRSLAASTPTYVPFERPTDLRLFTLAQIHDAWRDCEASVSGPSSARVIRRAMEERLLYLEELERRQPGLLSAWLAGAAGTEGGPFALTTAAAPDAATIDWDGLIGGQASDR